jgi:hypothetical protein
MDTLSDRDALSDLDVGIDADAHSENATRRLHRFVAVGLLGLLLIAAGLAVDAVLHALDPDLAAEEGLFTLRNPGHLLLAAGIGAAALGLGRAASILIERADDPSRFLRAGPHLLRLGLIGLVVAFGYIAAGPGFGHGHSGGISDALELSDGSRLSSSVAADVDRSRLPPQEAVALAALSWSRSGSVDLESDHDHGDLDSVAAPLTPAQQEALAIQLAAAAEVVPEFDTVEEAEALGYVQASNKVDGVGAHWVKWSLVDRPFDLAAPSMLLFEEVKFGEGFALIGYSYWVASTDEPEGFVGDTDEWHRHFGLCFESGWLITENTPDRSSCAGDWINGSDLWMLHAWIVPGLENRYGVFAPANPRLCERACT